MALRVRNSILINRRLPAFCVSACIFVQVLILVHASIRVYKIRVNNIPYVLVLRVHLQMTRIMKIHSDITSEEQQLFSHMCSNI